MQWHKRCKFSFNALGLCLSGAEPTCTTELIEDFNNHLCNYENITSHGSIPHVKQSVFDIVASSVAAALKI